MCLSLVKMGVIFWVGNTWALIPDNDPTTPTQVSMLFDGRLHNSHQAELDKDGDGVIPIAGGMLVRGNGDQDDNKEDPIQLRRVSVTVVQPYITKAATNFRDRRTVVAYKDFGHLKVMPAADFSVVSQNGFDRIKGRPCAVGGLCCSLLMITFIIFSFSSTLNSVETVCKDLKPIKKIEELLNQFYTNLDNNCLFVMPITELEKFWDIKILSRERLSQIQKLFQLRQSLDFCYNPFRSEKDAFYVEIYKNEKDATNVIIVNITKEYDAKHGTVFPDGNLSLMPEPLKIFDFKVIDSTPISNTLIQDKPKAKSSSIFSDNTPYTYYRLNSAKTRMIKLSGIEDSVTGFTVLNTVNQPYNQ